MRRSGATFVLAVFLLGTIASADAFARGSGGRGGGHGGRGGHHASGSMQSFRTVPRSAVVVTAPVFFGGYRAPYYPPFYGYPAAPYYSGAPYYPAAPYYPSRRTTRRRTTPRRTTRPSTSSRARISRRPHRSPGRSSNPGPSNSPRPTYWFCPAANNYFPYVRTCPSGWQQVAP